MSTQIGTIRNEKSNLNIGAGSFQLSNERIPYSAARCNLFTQIQLRITEAPSRQCVNRIPKMQ